MMRKLFGTKQDRDMRALKPILAEINSLEPKYQAMSDDELKNQTQIFKDKLQKGSTVNDILPDAFAVVREAGRRVMNMRHFDVQMLGGITLHQGKISEMKTGEGKTLTATLPLYLNALAGKGAHLVTVNDYLAQRDSHEMGKLYNWLGLSVGVIIANMDDEDRKAAYQADITYGTNNEFAFDYLRDNMKFDLNDYVQREHHFCIVDEVDSILIDEARTPLLISGPSEGDTRLYGVVDKIIPKLVKDTHYTVDEKAKSSVLTEEGILKVQELLQIGNLYDVRNIETLHHVNQSLRAHTLFKNEVDYVVRDGKVIIVDEFTGRMKEGSRWSDGLHQAVEAKEGVEVKSENQTLASITFQNYFRLYSKLSGMTGTADTEADEFMKIYNLEVVVIPTNLPMIRNDQADVVYATRQAKYEAVAKLIEECHKKGQPVLVGTISIESSELISNVLSSKGIKHEVLNAKNHAREAEIVALAGQRGGVTIATNMAGRGTDIKLTAETKSLGGLYIIGTERHESRRIDNQLRGRSGRQGDPGASKFFLSLEDDLMRIFGSDRIKGIMVKLGMKDDEPIEHSMITNAIAKAQKKVETHNFDIRKHLLDFDNVMNEQRKVIYKIRRDILNDEGNNELIQDFIDEVAFELAAQYQPEKKGTVRDFPWDEINQAAKNAFGVEQTLTPEECSQKHKGELADYLREVGATSIQKKFEGFDPEQVKYTYREVLLATFDQFWKDHLLAMDHLKEGINLRSYGQKDPLVEYKREAFTIYENMKFAIKRAVVERISHIKLMTQEEIEAIHREQEKLLQAQLKAHQDAMAAEAMAEEKKIIRATVKVGRNDPCPCGSGKKFKSCHGA
ncbi:preprotein translocase subunit SecA [Peredibacter starrii]|uniref:Protein translocase subunit SecA n=2 Tax=Peredibacter starrii TaxID=28202 RepID=A0AAX4HIT2_9BACT|nr:preprotein translocase subunit SecA [Peredibacter starrii]WPU63157.1 preprotein translocase subunit SecA [Peredibacter starrii]